jgi:hypothetical protein
VGHSEARHFPEVAVCLERGVTLMLKGNLLTSVAYFLVGLFNKCEGVNWA